MEPYHFDRWEELFIETLDDLFTGNKVDLARQRVKNIKGLMMYKIEQARV
jgi:hemoglobin